MCNTSLHLKVISLNFFARYVINFHRQTNTLCWKGEIKVFVSCLRHTNNCVFGYSGVSAIRASTKPILWKMFFWRKKAQTETGYQRESFSERAFIDTCVSTSLDRWRCWWANAVRTAALCISSFLPSSFSYMQCHSIASIGCVNGFEVEHKFSLFHCSTMFALHCFNKQNFVEFSNFQKHKKCWTEKKKQEKKILNHKTECFNAEPTDGLLALWWWSNFHSHRAMSELIHEFLRWRWPCKEFYDRHRDGFSPVVKVN